MKKLSTFNFKFSTPEGYTLIELLIVVAIIGVLATFTTMNYVGVKQRARDAQRKADLNQLRAALEFYRADLATYPAALPACGSPFTNAATVYINKIPCDPLNSAPYTYKYVSNGSTYSLIACLENTNDFQKDNTFCAGSATNWSYTVTSP